MMMNCPDALRMIPLALASDVCAVVNDSPARNNSPSARRIFMTAVAYFFVAAFAGLDSVLAAGLSVLAVLVEDFAESESFFAACL